jgi:fumarylacetoacetase
MQEPGSFGSMLELSWRGERPVQLTGGGGERKFINNNDTVIMRGHCVKGNVRVGFGECSGIVLPSVPL